MARPTVPAPPSPTYVADQQAAQSQTRRDQILALRNKASRTPADIANLLNLLADELLGS